MSGIKRYDHVSYGMVSDPNGEYIFHSDHDAEVARLRAEVEGLRVKASRYDWIRRNAVLDGANGDQLDSEIDAAMGASA